MGPLAAVAIPAGASLIGGYMASQAQKEANKNNIKAQYDFAKHGIRWKVADAQAAGIHPLAALGASTSSFSPSVVAEDGMAQGISNMGQDIGRAMNASRTDQEKQLTNLQIQSMEKDIAGKEIDNQIRAKTLANLSLQKPSFPGSEYLLPGQQQSGLVQGKPMERTTARVTSPHSEGAPVSDVGWAETEPGVFIAVPSKDIKERIEDNVFHEGAHFIRNLNRQPPDDWLSSGQKWRYSWSKGGWVKSNRK